MDELDQVENGKKLATKARERVGQIVTQFKANDAEVDRMIDEKFKPEE